jgi:arylsulfatase A-like enzyme
MDALAALGVQFEQAFVATPICAASRASILTGLYEHTHGYTFTKPPLDQRLTGISYPTLLREAGYHTGFIGKLGVGLEDGLIEEMFDTHRVTAYPYFKEVAGEMRHLTELHGDYAVEFIRESPADRPFCLSLSFWAPHADDGSDEQYFWPPACDALYREAHIPAPDLSDPAFFEALPEFLKRSLNRTRWHWRFDDPLKYQQMVKGYYRMISGIDLVIGRLMAELERSGEDRNTVIIFTSDNGYFLGERGFAGKWLMHDLSIGVPLIVLDPRARGRRQGAIRNELALNIDLPPTILELAGLPVPQSMQGRSLLPLIEGKMPVWRDDIVCEHLWDHPEIPRSECLRTDRWKYIHYPDHPEYEELYDLTKDPAESVNLSREASHAPRLQELRDRLTQRLALSGGRTDVPRY